MWSPLRHATDVLNGGRCPAEHSGRHFGNGGLGRITNTFRAPLKIRSELFGGMGGKFQSHNGLSIGDRHHLRFERPFGEFFYKIGKHPVNLHDGKWPAQNLNDGREKLFPAKIEMVAGLVRQLDRKFCQKHGEFIRIAMPGIFQEFEGDMIGGIWNTFVQKGHQSRQGFMSGLPSFLPCDQILQIFQIGTYGDAADVLDRSALGVLSIRLVLHMGPFQNPMGTGEE